MINVQPTQIIILGGSGDLSKRKLLPALLDLFSRGKMPEQFNIIGLARTPRTDTEYRQFVTESIAAHKHNHKKNTITHFCEHISYVTGHFDETKSYADLKDALTTYEEKIGCTSNKLFYLAVPPKYYKSIFEQLSSTKIALDNKKISKWSRILVEKPFGDNLKTAIELEDILSSLFKEEQIFRIDHYLAKDAVQNILSFRFANTLFTGVWSKKFIKEVRITMNEDIDVGTRGNFYDNVGALRDVGQNHLLQLLALIAMEEPEKFTADKIREKRAEVLTSLIQITNIQDQVKRAQYEGYHNTDGVNKHSETETYFAIRAYVDMPQWKNIPFYISAGKALDHKKVSIEVTFKDVASGMFDTDSCNSTENKLKLTISPTQSMNITLNAKTPGLGYQLEQRDLSVDCECHDEIKNSYEKVLLDCIAGDQTLFTSTSEVLAAWRFITPILEKWNNIPLQTYKKGSEGPK